MKKLLCLLLLAVPCLHAQQGSFDVPSGGGTNSDTFIPTIRVGLQPVESLTIGDMTYEQVKLTGFANNIVKFSHAVGNKSIPVIVLTRAQIDALNGTNDKIVIKPGSMDLSPPSDESVQKALALIRQAGDIEGLLPNGNTPLIEAASLGDCGMLKALIMRDADLNMRTASDRSAISVAAVGRHSRAAVLLREAGARAPDLMTAVLSGDVAMVKEHISKNKNLLRAVDRDGMTPLMRAAVEDQSEVILALVGMGASVDETGMTEGRTPLMAASASGRVGSITTLLSRGANVQAKDKLGWTPIMHAAAAGQAQAVTLLLSKGAKISSPGGGDIMALARERGQTNVVSLLEQMERSAKEAELAAAARASNAAAAKVSKAPIRPKVAAKPSAAAPSPSGLLLKKPAGDEKQAKEVPGWIYTLLFVGILIYIVGNFWMIGLAWHESMGWAIIMFLFNPLPNVIYFCLHVRETWIPFTLLCCGGTVAMVAAVLSGIQA